VAIDKRFVAAEDGTRDVEGDRGIKQGIREMRKKGRRQKDK
jgi:hypothetical protein